MALTSRVAPESLHYTKDGSPHTVTDARRRPRRPSVRCLCFLSASGAVETSVGPSPPSRRTCRYLTVPMLTAKPSKSFIDKATAGNWESGLSTQQQPLSYNLCGSSDTTWQESSARPRDSGGVAQITEKMLLISFHCLSRQTSLVIITFQ